ncbi:2-amino-4-hydroxy-6-hydroxymethyldihydropteridine diphosphokinase [Sphingomonas sp.]|uniref:2-amino-4-hydroxy-6- hydroxymethyldihydropteridine diphosphokinase n=1 Tax=Sphingomonas sp. TaxID=28214 RepID=UPI003B0006F7
MAATSYLIGLGSNRAHGRYGQPAAVLRAALDALAVEGLAIDRVSATIRSRPLGPGGRDYANTAALVSTDCAPPALLRLLKRIEREFGRRRGRRWGARVLDLDILAWEGGRWRTRALLLPHPGLPHRGFALGPAAAIAPRWRIGSVMLAALEVRRLRPRPVDRPAARALGRERRPGP